MKERSFQTHVLEQCLFLSYRRATTAEKNTVEYQGELYKLDGIGGLHVDDFLAAGEGACTQNDLKDGGEPDCFRGRFANLVRRYRFGTLDFGEEILFCGAEIFQSGDFGYIEMDLEQYTHHIKPITVEKARSAHLRR